MGFRKEGLSRINGWEQSIACMTRDITAEKYDRFTDPHYHEYIELLYGLSGSAKVLIGDRVYNMDEGDLFIVNAREVHDVCCDAEAHYFVIKFLPNLLYSHGGSLSGVRYLLPLWQKEVAFSPALRARELQGSGVAELIAEIKREWETNDIGFEQVMHADIMQVFVWILRYRCPQAAQSPDFPESLMKSLGEVLEKTQDHLCDWTAKDAAAYCNLSYSYFSRNFKRAYNISFTAYLESMRLREAERLLLTTDKEVTEIAQLCGFGTTSYFIERFRSSYGISPRRFKMRMRY